MASLRREIGSLLAVAWAPLILLGGRHAIAHDLAVHARFLVSVPLILVAGRELELSSHTVFERLAGEGFATRDELTPLSDAAQRLRRSRLPELALVLIALAVGVAALAGRLPFGLLVSIEQQEHGAVRYYYALVSLPLFQVLSWRALWHWVIWCKVLFGLAHLRLRTVPTHPDRRAGLALLRQPSRRYFCWLLPAGSAIAVAAWGTRVLRGSPDTRGLQTLLAVYLITGIGLAFAPLFLFVPHLFRARRQGLRQYGGLATEYSRRFAERWLSDKRPDDLLGNNDFCALVDLNTAYRESVEHIRLYLFSARDLILVTVATLAPVLPLVLYILPIDELIIKLLHILVGGR
jgi:hypothetical protein